MGWDLDTSDDLSTPSIGGSDDPSMVADISVWTAGPGAGTDQRSGIL